jgi:AraC family transcriptional regulator
LAHRSCSHIKNYIEEHLDANITLSQITLRADLAPYHFARSFKRETGAPPHRYVMERRVDRAKTMLISTDLGFAEIALACGVANQRHFTTAFKRHRGVTPVAWPTR